MHRDRGFISLVITLIIALLILSYFGFDLRTFLDKPIVRENLAVAWGLVKEGWALLVAFIQSFTGFFNK